MRIEYICCRCTRKAWLPNDMPVDDKSTKDLNQAANGGTAEASIDASLLVPETVDGITQPIAAIALTEQVTETRGVTVLIIIIVIMRAWTRCQSCSGMIFLCLRNCECLTGTCGQRSEPAEVSRGHSLSLFA